MKILLNCMKVILSIFFILYIASITAFENQLILIKVTLFVLVPIGIYVMLFFLVLMHILHKHHDLKYMFTQIEQLMAPFVAIMIRFSDLVL